MYTSLRVPVPRSLARELHGPVLEQRHDPGVRQGGDVPELRGVNRGVLGELSQDAPHDLPRAGLRQTLRELDGVGGGDGPDLLPHDRLEPRRQLVARDLPVLEHDVAVDARALDLVGHADDGSLRARRVQHEGGFHLRGSHAVPGDVDDVVDPACDPVVPVGVAPAPVACDVVALEHGVVHALEPRVIAVAGSRRGRPGFLDGQKTRRLALELDALVVEHHGLDAEEREGGGPGLERGGARQRGDHERSRLSLPVGVDDGASLLADDGVVPPPSLRVDGLADGTQDAQAAAIVLGDEVVARLHQRANRGGGGVELVHLVLLADGPAPAGVGVRGHPFEHHRRRALEQRAVDDVGVAGDPPDVRGAPVHLAGLVVEHVLERRPRSEHVPGGGVNDTLGLPGAPGGVQHEKRVLGLDPLARAVGGDLVHLVVPPRVPSVNHRALAREPLEHDDGFDGEVVLAQFQSRVHLGLELNGLRAAHHRVARHDNLALGVRHPPADRLGAEPAEDHGVDGADSSAR
mmetsp:Transcript_10234/g.44499  ORF Transcript_10234/g.44499 Transcript_10234/m.44499 type:complete len:518 (-) Transcript_10234:769-2322(-)